MKNVDNIILVGMPGSGKSTVGVLLAKSIMYSFCDTDLVIQSQTGSRLCDIINNAGIASFLETENSIIAAMPTMHRTVIATGGSAVYGRAAMKRLSESGVVVWLDIPEKELENRIKNITTRGIAMKKDETLESVYNERLPLYEACADVHLCCAGLTTEETVEEIIEALDK